jgi:hypothetical protein
MSRPSARSWAALAVLSASIACQPAREAAPTPGETTPTTPQAAPTPREATPTPPGETPVEDLRRDITSAQGEPTCSSADQCRTVAFGAKPCGGPRSYLIYSTAAADTARLATLVAEYNRLEAEANAREGRVSDCMFVAQPTVACVSGRCVVGEAR